uniref:Uncharacterized protein n=1 Tax=Vespula pensylvanica TaxID=30213 RepID=A0A834U8U5_VESPE|nr:hypothetical protein H0235_009757 [Vespula pensylvanica]
MILTKWLKVNTRVLQNGEDNRNPCQTIRQSTKDAILAGRDRSRRVNSIRSKNRFGPAGVRQGDLVGVAALGLIEPVGD